MRIADELEFLKWFYVHTDFGPADSDVKARMFANFESIRSCRIPSNYRLDYLDDEV